MIEFSVLVLARNEAKNLALLLPEIHRIFKENKLSYELLLIDGASIDDTSRVAASLGAITISQVGVGYGAAFQQGLKAAKGQWIITLDADLSHPPAYLESLFIHKGEADLIIASRYIDGGKAHMESYRHILSLILNTLYRLVLRLPIRDLTSGFRMYRSETLKAVCLEARDFDVLIEILIKLVKSAASVKEIPFHYEPRVFGTSNAKLFRFAISYVRTLIKMKRLCKG